MALKIVTVDTNGVKERLLDKREFGYDDFEDIGRVSIGTGSEDIKLAQLREVEALQKILEEVNIKRADKFLSAQNIAKMLYDDEGDLIKIQYIEPEDVHYEIFTYADGEMTGIAHYVDGELQGNTVLSYDNTGLVSVIYTEV